jgi:hypothetical protein
VTRFRELATGEERAGARALGGLLLAIAVLVILIRRTSFADPWEPLPLFVIFLVTTAILLGVGVLGGRWREARPLGWQIVWAVLGIALVPFTLYAFLAWVEGDANAPLNTAWIFLVTGLAGLAAALVAGVRAGCLLGALALIVSWLGLWGELLDDGLGADVGTLRGLLVLAAAIVIALAIVLTGLGLPEGGFGDMVTAAGIVAVLAGAVSLAALPGSILFAGASGFEPQVEASLFWDSWLLLVTLGLLLYGAAAGLRGPVYVGVVGLIAFTYLVGLDADDDTPSGSLLGWPLVLLAGSIVLIAASAIPALRRGRS